MVREMKLAESHTLEVYPVTLMGRFSYDVNPSFRKIKYFCMLLLISNSAQANITDDPDNQQDFRKQFILAVINRYNLGVDALMS